MKTKQKLSDELITETLDGLSEGLKPIIDNFDGSKLNKADRIEISQLLDELEAKALEVKANLKR